MFKLSVTSAADGSRLIWGYLIFLPLFEGGGQKIKYPIKVKTLNQGSQSRKVMRGRKYEYSTSKKRVTAACIIQIEIQMLGVR